MPTIERAGTSIHDELAGESGPNVLLIQGCGVTGEGWRPQVDVLARDHRVAIFDNRGIGKSVLGGPVTIAERPWPRTSGASSAVTSASSRRSR